jgi:hypothetical protein
LTLVSLSATLARADTISCPVSPTAFSICATFDTTITGDAHAITIENTIKTAIAAYDAAFKDPITVRITFSEMTSGLGQSSFYLYNIPYSEFYTKLVDDGSSVNDSIALAHLTGGTNNPVTGESQIFIKSANAKALGINLGLPANQSDGTVSLNTSLTTPGSPGTSGSYSLLSVTEHEIDEILGLGSTLGLGYSPPYSNYPSPEDLFRYDGSGSRSYTTSPSALAYLSIDKTTLLTQFNNTGSGDYGDWASSATPQVQDAFGTPGGSATLGKNELTALDVIGYTLAPEPSTWWLLVTGIGLIALRHKKRSPKRPLY